MYGYVSFHNEKGFSRPYDESIEREWGGGEATAEGNTENFPLFALKCRFSYLLCCCLFVFFLVLSIVDDVVVTVVAVVVVVHTLERVFTICTYLIGFTKATPALEKPQRNYKREQHLHAPLYALLIIQTIAGYIQFSTTPYPLYIERLEGGSVNIKTITLRMNT